MTPEETGQVLARCAMYDNRRVDTPTVIMWHRAIGDLPYQDCEDAVVAHYTASTDWLMPAHIRSQVKAIRRDRIARDPSRHALPPEMADQPGRYREALHARIKEIADGKQVIAAIGPLADEHPPPIAELRSQLGPALPPPERLLPLEEIARRQVAESRAARLALPAAEPDTGKPAA